MNEANAILEFVRLAQPKTFPACDMLDVTLRDGGFLTSFDWSRQFVSNHAVCMFLGGVRSIELGYIGGVSNGDGWHTGLAANVPLDVVSQVSGCVPGGNLHCIVNPWRMRTLGNLNEYRSAGLKTLRIAYNEKHRETVWRVVESSQTAGLLTVINITAISTLTKGAVDAVIDAARARGIDGVYFADTCSAMRPDELFRLFSNARSRLGPDMILGLHGHDFNGFGMANSYMSVLGGANSIDMSIRGIGRGGGNVRTELWCLASILGKAIPASSFDGILRALAAVESRLGLTALSLLPALSAACNLNPEVLEHIYQTTSISQQNAIVAGCIELLRQRPC